jgi:hypothetical protein
MPLIPLAKANRMLNSLREFSVKMSPTDLKFNSNVFLGGIVRNQSLKQGGLLIPKLFIVTN